MSGVTELVTADCRIHRQPGRTDVTVEVGRWPWEHPAWATLATISWASTCRACCKEPGRRSPPTWLDWSPRRPGSCRSRRWDTSCRAPRQRRDRAGEPGRVRPLAAGTADAPGQHRAGPVLHDPRYADAGAGAGRADRRTDAGPSGRRAGDRAGRGRTRADLHAPTQASHAFEQIEASSKWYQLYWPTDRDVCLSFLQRAKASGYGVLVVTLDTGTLGWRPADLDRGFLPFLKGEGLANYFQ